MRGVIQSDFDMFGRRGFVRRRLDGDLNRPIHRDVRRFVGLRGVRLNRRALLLRFRGGGGLRGVVAALEIIRFSGLAPLGETAVSVFAKLHGHDDSAPL